MTRAPDELYLSESGQLEAQVLAILIENPREFHRVTIQPGQFSRETWRRVAEVLWPLLQRKAPVDAILAAQALTEAYPPEMFGMREQWLAIIAKLLRGTVAPVNNLEYYQERLLQMYQCRQLAGKLGDLVEGITVDTVQERLATTIKALMHLAEAAPQWEVGNQAMIHAAVDHLDSLDPRRPPGISSGLADFDRKLGGFHKTDLVIIAARPAMGKTSLLLNIMDACGVPVGFISGEQGRLQIGMRRLALKGGVPLHRMRNAQLDDEDWRRIAEAGGELEHRRVYTNDKPGPSIDEIEQQARAWKHSHGIEALEVDYLQKIRVPGVRDMRERVGLAAARLKDLGRELDIPVICFAQVKREIEERALGPQGLGRMPNMSDIAESGIVEQEADQVITLYRPGVYDDQNNEWRGLAYLNICKNRHGSTGFMRVRWVPEYLRFANWNEEADPYSRQRSFM